MALNKNTEKKGLDGYFGEFGGQYVPETLVPALEELTKAYRRCSNQEDFWNELGDYFRDYSGRPTPLFMAPRLSEYYSRARRLNIYLKREDLNHTGAHKLNNALGQVLLAQRMGKQRIIAETGAGQHGLAVASVCAHFGLKCRVYMGAVDIRRQAPNVYKMKLLGAEVVSVTSGTQTLKEACSEAIRDWVTNVDSTHYIIGSVVGPHPYPLMVREFQKVIGVEARRQFLERTGALPDCVIACVGGGSNAMGMFHPFIEDDNVSLFGIEAAGEGIDSGKHAAALEMGKKGVLHGSLSYLLQNEYGQIEEAHSISAGLDYPGVGPEHAYLKDGGRVHYHSVTDAQALAAFYRLTQLEGIIPALESAHALAFLDTLDNHIACKSKDINVLLCLSGRGDKDMDTVRKGEGHVTQ